jgi:acyl phosphate:glycerol-3-phosphate acyltransferase
VIWFLVVALVSYIIGSVPSGYIAGRLAGVDIRTVGSGNIGATNVTRNLGKKYGYPVFAADFCKGLIAVFVANRLAQQPGAIASADIYEIVAAVCCVLGNGFPVWLGFHGGKGVAVSAGLLSALMPWAALIGIALWVVLFFSTRYVSLASIFTALMLPLVVLTLLHFGKMREWSFLYVSIALTAFIVVRHRSNISRLLSGTEERFTKRAD